MLGVDLDDCLTQNHASHMPDTSKIHVDHSQLLLVRIFEKSPGKINGKSGEYEVDCASFVPLE